MTVVSVESTNGGANSSTLEMIPSDAIAAALDFRTTDSVITMALSTNIPRPKIRPPRESRSSSILNDFMSKIATQREKGIDASTIMVALMLRRNAYRTQAVIKAVTAIMCFDRYNTVSRSAAWLMITSTRGLLAVWKLSSSRSFFTSRQESSNPHEEIDK